jgi:hypothetical protein
LECFDCGTRLSERDLLVASCQSCGEPLLPDDLIALRAELGIAEAKPPEIINPIIESKPLEIPDSVDCPACFTPLMGIDLDAWNQGICNYCSEINPSQTLSATSEIHENNDEEVVTMPKEMDGENIFIPENSLPFIINVGPSVGEIIHLPIGDVGRSHFHQILKDSWYKDHINRISSEHLRIGENYEIIDLGSTNKTYINGARVSGTKGVNLNLGSDLNLGGNIQLTRADVSGTNPSIEHVETGIKWHIPFKDADDAKFSSSKWSQHLGRLTEDDEFESWYRMADLHLRAMNLDETFLTYISRRHMVISCEQEDVTLEVFEGKETPSGFPENPTIFPNDLTLQLNKNTFNISINSVSESV